MYCRKCKNLLPENEFICNHCKFDNFFESAYQETLREKKNIKTNNQSSVFSVVVLFILVCIGVVLFYSVNETKAYDVIKPQTTNTIKIKVNKQEFIFENFKFMYLDTFGTSTNTIFYKKNTDINISINNILNTDYDTVLNSNDCLETTLKNIPAHTYAGDNFYSYVFTHNNNFYEIKVNYINDPNIYNEGIQSSLSEILKSIEII